MATPVYVFDECDNIYRRWPKFSLIKDIVTYPADYKGWEIVVGNGNDFIYGIGGHAIFKQSYGGGPETISFEQFLLEIFPYIRAYDWDAKLNTVFQA
jgi:hypothetical protein